MKKELLTIALALTMGLSMTGCKGAKKDDTAKEDSEKTVEKTVKKTIIKKQADDDEDEDEDVTLKIEDDEDDEDVKVKSDDKDEDDEMKDDDSKSEKTSSEEVNPMYQSILDRAGYTGRPNTFSNKKTLQNTSFAKYIDGGIEIIEVGSKKDQIYEIIESAIYPLPGYTVEQMEQLNVQYQTRYDQAYGQYSSWIEITCSIIDDCEVVRFRYKNLDDPQNAAALAAFGHCPYTSLDYTTNAYIAGGLVKK